MLFLKESMKIILIFFRSVCKSLLDAEQQESEQEEDHNKERGEKSNIQ